MIQNSCWIAPGSMENGYGRVDVQLLNKALEKLNSNHPKGVYFDPAQLSYQVSGGVCSAHSLGFINGLLVENKKPLHQRVLNSAKNYKRSNIELRTHQAALNCISKVNSQEPEDFMKAKVEALVSLYNLEVNFASKDDLYLKNTNSTSLANRADFYNVVESLPEGIFLIRAIAKKDNHKGEYYGHSMAYINDPSGQYFFDPTHGCSQIASKEVKEKLYEYVATQCDSWGLNYPRFYRLNLQENFNE
ncbi:MAG: hypothetical protein S4CHLAM7_00160 [Chlamydiae bacterium]|nr:hypothetical protein [Chlamydiota bacterium]